MSLYAPRVAAGGFVGTARKPSEVRGVMFHMAEGGMGRRTVADYLAGDPLRNVSVHYTIEKDGRIIPMVPELRVAGSLNPDALRSDTGPYYGREHLDYVLKGGSRNANRYVIAVEIAGTAKRGPNALQVTAMVRLFKDLLKRYPNIKPLGHRDQQDVKPCPGGTKAMRTAFTAIGGHGKDYRKVKPAPRPDPIPDDPKCIEALAAANGRIAELEDQVEAMQAAIHAAMDTLDGVVE